MAAMVTASMPKIRIHAFSTTVSFILLLLWKTSYPLSTVKKFLYDAIMRRSVARIKGLGFVFWHARHEFFHVLIGLVWAWVLREVWGQFNPRWFWLSAFGSLLPYAD